MDGIVTAQAVVPRQGFSPRNQQFADGHSRKIRPLSGESLLRPSRAVAIEGAAAGRVEESAMREMLPMEVIGECAADGRLLLLQVPVGAAA